MYSIQIVTAGRHGVLDAMGATIEFLVPPSAADGAYCVIQGTLPAGMPVPLHSHADDESFVVLTGEIEALVLRERGHEWRKVSVGEFVHVPGNVKHAWRNRSPEPVVQVITTTSRLGRFFQDAGRVVIPGQPRVSPSPAEVQRFTQLAARYGHWLASPEENAAVGISLPAMP